jgi:hypothetical protein
MPGVTREADAGAGQQQQQQQPMPNAFDKKQTTLFKTLGKSSGPRMDKATLKELALKNHGYAYPELQHIQSWNWP